MILARVLGPVVSTVKIRSLEGHKLLLVRPVRPDGSLTGKPVVAVDTVQAGKGDTVLVLDEGGSAGIMLGLTGQPVRTIITGIVDSIENKENDNDKRG